ncbi:DUF4282 domain-containing protein [Spirillospora sp. NPDC047279]|uniref:DUF4282 domain-containing protein n=1 Tax=Spirillospora sp. NPDC047279 TaxID=3155478 RepID=UPI0033DC9B2A
MKVLIWGWLDIPATGKIRGSGYHPLVTMIPPPELRPKPPTVLTALTDTRFTTLVTPLVVSWIYRGCMVVVAMMTVWWMLLSVAVMTWRNGWMWGVLGLAASPVLGLVLVLIVRVVCEAVLVRFHRRG